MIVQHAYYLCIDLPHCFYCRITLCGCGLFAISDCVTNGQLVGYLLLLCRNYLYVIRPFDGGNIVLLAIFTHRIGFLNNLVLT